jgi:PKD repeat protein
MRRNVGRIFPILFLFLAATYVVTIKPQVREVSASEPFPTSRPVVFVTPDVIEQDVGVEFTVSVKIFNLTDTIWTDPETNKPYPLGNLYGVGMNFTWDPNVLEYITHTVKIPWDDWQPDGVLYNPTTAWEDNLNLGAGWYKIGYSSQNPAPVFNNEDQNNTVFDFTFRAKQQGSSDLRLTQVALPGKTVGERVYHEGYATATGRSAVFNTPGAPVAKFSVWPTDLYAGVNKPVRFNASESFDTDGTVTDYLWDFGDGNTGAGQIVNHTYTSTGTPKVTLKVRDNDNVESRPVEKTLRILERRDVMVRDITLMQLIKYGTVTEINVTVSSKGGIGGARENFDVSLYYNSSSSDDWVLIDSQSVINLTTDAVLSFNWDTSLSALPPAGASYFYRIVANATFVPHEANATDNTQVTDPPVEVTGEDIHDVGAMISSVSFEAGATSFNTPFILGENVTVRFQLQALGTMDETFNITLLVIARNGTELLPPRRWNNELLEYGKERSYRFSTEDLPATYCNITLKVDLFQVDRNPEDNYRSVEVRVVKPPTIDIDYPANIYQDESTEFDASASIHQDPEGQITGHIWDVQAGSEVFGSLLEGNPVSYTFNSTGSTTVRLRIQDNFGLTFDSSVQDLRPLADAYMLEVSFDVQRRSGGGSQFPIDPLYIVIIVVVVVGVVIVAFRLLRKPKPPE